MTAMNAREVEYLLIAGMNFLLPPGERKADRIAALNVALNPEAPE